jgi:predicted dehydrogenase
VSGALRVVTLGAGYFAQFHHDGWRRIPGVDLAGVADADPESGAPHRDLKELLALRPDIVDIATPPASHAAAIRAALRARPRAILCQKPFCASLPLAEAVAAEAEAAGVPLVVHENFRFQPWWRAIRDAVAGGAVGRVATVAHRFRPGDGRGPDAYLARQPYLQRMPRFLLHETGVHYLDVFTWLLGPPAGVYADLRRLNPAIAGEDAGLVVLDWEDGARALWDADRLAEPGPGDPRLTFGTARVEGEAGTLVLGTDGGVTLRADGREETVLAPRAWEGFAGDSVRALQAHAVAALRGEGPWENAARDYLAVMRLVEAAYASAERGARVDLATPGG